ncbi:MAG: GMP synthase [Thermodesulfobacteria bacterium]|nr:GMP synthase [Thermodesulfobacteriota bacterium]
MAKIIAIRHVEFENLGFFEDIFKELGFDYTYLDTPKGERLNSGLEDVSGIVILGGYMGAYEEDKYEFLKYEYEVMEEAFKKKLPLIGICLGAQMIAKFLGARVYKGERGKEIGWYEIFKTGEHPYFEEFPERLKVLQWHGDTFDLPKGATRVYSSEKYPNQAFVFEKAVALQFHIEVKLKDLPTWISAYEKELKEVGISKDELLNTDVKEEVLKDLCRRLVKKIFGIK